RTCARRGSRCEADLGAQRTMESTAAAQFLCSAVGGMRCLSVDRIITVPATSQLYTPPVPARQAGPRAPSPCAAVGQPIAVPPSLGGVGKNLLACTTG